MTATEHNSLMIRKVALWLKMRNRRKVIFLDFGAPSFSSALSSLSSVDLLFTSKASNSITLPKIMTKTNTSLMNLTNKAMRSQKHMILFYSTPLKLSALTGPLDHIMCLKLVILLVSSFTFKVEDGATGLMNNKLFKSAIKGRKCGLELPRKIRQQ